MAKESNANLPTVEDASTDTHPPELDSKYRMIIVAAQRSKQLQRGARPRVELESQRHKPTRIALEEIQQGKIGYKITEKE